MAYSGIEAFTERGSSDTAADDELRRIGYVSSVSEVRVFLPAAQSGNTVRDARFGMNGHDFLSGISQQSVPTCLDPSI